MATAAPASSTPPNFYENLPSSGGAETTSPDKKKSGEGEPDEVIMKGFGKVMSVLDKMAELNEGLKPGVGKIKQQLKDMTVQVLKKNPQDLDSGDDKSAASAQPAAAEPSPAAQPMMKDETHAA